MENTKLEPKEAKQMNGLTLAYIGDAVFEIFVREKLISEYPNLNVFELHKKAVKIVNCNNQSRILGNLIEKEFLTEDELYIVKRGKNCKARSIPKNADRKTYMEATGFEALVGYLYLTGSDRLEIIMSEEGN